MNFLEAIKFWIAKSLVDLGFIAAIVMLCALVAIAVMVWDGLSRRWRRRK